MSLCAVLSSIPNRSATSSRHCFIGTACGNMRSSSLQSIRTNAWRRIRLLFINSFFHPPTLMPKQLRSLPWPRCAFGFRLARGPRLGSRRALCNGIAILDRILRGSLDLAWLDFFSAERTMRCEHFGGASLLSPWCCVRIYPLRFDNDYGFKSRHYKGITTQP